MQACVKECTRRAVNSESYKGFKPGVKDSDKEGSRKPLSRDNSAWTGLEQETEVWLRTY